VSNALLIMFIFSSLLSLICAIQFLMSFFIVCILLCVIVWLSKPSTQQICQKLNQCNITVLHWFYLVTAACFDPYLDHRQAVFLNTSLIIELSQYRSMLVVIVKTRYDACNSG
jgi:hypothetical protein